MLGRRRGRQTRGAPLHVRTLAPVIGAYLLALGSLCAAVSVPLPASAAVGTLDHAVLAELNYARTHPDDYARLLRRAAQRGDGGGRYASVTETDPDAVDEAIDFLERQRPLPPLRPDPKLAASARDHVIAQGREGDVGHNESSGVSFGQRLKRHGVWAGLSAEDISYGYDAPHDVVRQLIIDSGVANRGHRKNIFDPTLTLAGVSCGRHSVYGAMCVIDFAGAMAPER